MKNSTLDQVSYALLVIGGLNWGLIGFFEYNLIEEIGFPSGIERTIYALVGLAALYVAYTLFWARGRDV